MYVFTSQQLCLLNQATNIWQRRGKAKQFGLSFNEESATEVLLQDIASQYPGKVTIIPFSKSKESQYGADWAWGFVGPDGSLQGMLVQAKRLDDGGIKYEMLDHIIGKKKSNGPTKWQIEVLIKNGLKYDLPPVYAFYNHLNNPNHILPNFCRSFGMINQSSPESWGIAIASAITVRDKSNILNQKKKTDKTFNCHKEHSRPLHCLLCSQGTGRMDPKGSAGAAAAVLAEMFENTLDEEFIQKKESLFDTQGDWPELFQAAEKIYQEDWPHEEIQKKELSDKFPGIAGVVILRDSRD